MRPGNLLFKYRRAGMQVSGFWLEGRRGTLDFDGVKVFGQAEKGWIGDGIMEGRPLRDKPLKLLVDRFSAVVGGASYCTLDWLFPEVGGTDDLAKPDLRLRGTGQVEGHPCYVL